MGEQSENTASTSLEAGKSERTRNDFPQALAAFAATGEVIIQIFDKLFIPKIEKFAIASTQDFMSKVI